VKEASMYLGRTPIIRMSVTADNIHHAFDSFVAMDKLSCVVHLTLVPESGWTNEHVKIAHKEFTKIINYYAKASYDRPIKFNVAEACVRSGFTGCQTGNNMVGIDVDGNIYPCHRFVFHPDVEKWKMGDIYGGINRYPNFEEYFKKCEGCSTTICHPCPSQMILSKETTPPAMYCAVYSAIQSACSGVAHKVHDYNKDQIIVKTLAKLLGEIYDRRPKEDINS
jgi:radical SAM protein with 4Fe4S-binding SPASM domain